MCLALPARIVAIEGLNATVDLAGIRKNISIALVPNVKINDYVIVHVGFAIGQVDPIEAERTLLLFADSDASRGTLA